MIPNILHGRLDPKTFKMAENLAENPENPVVNAIEPFFYIFPNFL